MLYLILILHRTALSSYQSTGILNKKITLPDNTNRKLKINNQLTKNR